MLGLNHWFIDSVIHWFIHLLICCFIDPLIHWCGESLTHWFIQWAVHGFFHLMGISTTMCSICSFVDAPHNFNTSLLLHRKNSPIGHWFPIAMSLFRNFRPGMGRALQGGVISQLMVVSKSLGPIQLQKIVWNPTKSHEIPLNRMKSHETPWNPIKPR